jgi:DNA-binding NarL/FixJ family response regulator
LARGPGRRCGDPTGWVASPAAAIARQLRITEKAVVQHVSRIYDQLGLGMSDEDHRRVLAVIHYRAN